MKFILEIICLKNKGWEVINLDQYTDVGTHWIVLYVVNIEIFVLTVSQLNMFLKKLRNLLVIKA